jgi:hypothetical protein
MWLHVLTKYSCNFSLLKATGYNITVLRSEMRHALWFLLLGKSLQFKLKFKPLNSFYQANTCVLTSVQLCVWHQPVEDETVSEDTGRKLVLPWGPWECMLSLYSSDSLIYWYLGPLSATEASCDLVSFIHKCFSGTIIYRTQHIILSCLHGITAYPLIGFSLIPYSLSTTGDQEANQTDGGVPSCVLFTVYSHMS